MANAHELEPEVMVKAIEAVQSVVDVPLCIDSSVPGALIAGLKAAGGRPLINSVTGEAERLEKVLPLVAEYKVAVIAISNDEIGHQPWTPGCASRWRSGSSSGPSSYGIPREDVLIDPLVMPVGAVQHGGPGRTRHPALDRRRPGLQYGLRRQQRLVRPARPGDHQR